uniref:HPS6 biosis of lysosomal organelles complex 2 subunit 3 n=1 Tax=Fundulus heteroclitus TaxID=8078 RepID=A0A3Q2NUI9_FUNHE
MSRLSDFGDYAGMQKLSDLFTFPSDERSGPRLSDVRVSPDGRHIHVLLREPKVGLMTFDKYERPQLAVNAKKLDVWFRGAVPVVDVFYLDRLHGEDRGTGAVAAVVYENGRAEFWQFAESKPGWHLLQTSDLCNGPRARVVSVCACAGLLVWCEERPASESSAALGSARNHLRYCVCRRDCEVQGGGGVSLGGLSIILHNNPKFTVVRSADRVHLLPDPSAGAQLCSSKLLLTWSPQQDSFTVSTVCKSTPIKKLSAKESDFRRLVTDCLGYLSALEPPDVRGFSPAGCGGLLLLLGSGWLCLLQRDGTLRRLHRLADDGAHASLCACADAVALVAGRTLHVIEASCGRELQKVALKREGWLCAGRAGGRAPHLLSEAGLFALVDRESAAEPLGAGPAEGVRPGALLVEAVFEEACKYYQQRSLSGTQLTVDALKRGGRFQSPLSLASILRNYLDSGWRRSGLMSSLEGELRALVSLEELKGSLVRGGVKEAEAACETLVEREVARLLSSSELDRDALLYLNSIFSIFPGQAWRAAQAALQLHPNGEGPLCSRAPPDVWKAAKPPGLPEVLPVFELLCRAVFHFQPSWLPRFLELCQQQQGSAGGESGVPLYKRALWVLSSLEPEPERRRELEVELLLVSGRPNAVLQALRTLTERRQWERVTQVARQFCKQSPLLNKEIFTALLCEVARHRELDPHLELLWALCPEDFTVASILNLALKEAPPGRAPFAGGGSSQLTVGQLRPLLSKVLQREAKPSQRYADILQSPSYPPPALPRRPVPGPDAAAFSCGFGENTSR